MNDWERNASLGSLMLLVGGVIGAGFALLYAPQSGRRTRRQIVSYGRKVQNEAEAMIRDTAAQVTDLLEDLGEKSGELIDRGSEATENWRKHLLESLEKGEKALEEKRRQLTRAWR